MVEGDKLLTSKLGGMGASSLAIPVGTIMTILADIFSSHLVRQDEGPAEPLPGVTDSTEYELAVVVFDMRENKAPGPDGIPAEVLKVVVGSYLLLLLNMFNICIVVG